MPRTTMPTTVKSAVTSFAESLMPRSTITVAGRCITTGAGAITSTRAGRAGRPNAAPQPLHIDAPGRLTRLHDEHLICSMARALSAAVRDRANDDGLSARIRE